MQLRKLLAAGVGALAGLSLLAGGASAESRITLKSAKSTSSYYVMMVQLAEMLKDASGGDILPTVEESQGSVQNVKESKVRPGNFFFTSPPSLLAAAREGRKPFEGESFDTARTLFVMPFVTIHFVVREDAEVATLSDLAGKDFIAGGKGSFCERRAKSILDALELTDKIDLVDVELDAAAPAVRNAKVDGFVTCSSHPTPGLVELATTTPVEVLSLTAEERQTIVELDPLSGPVTIGAGTYKGQDREVSTVGVPVGGYGTAGMDEEVAYFLTKTFWEWKDRLAGENPWWDGVTVDLLSQMGAPLHPGARRYYEEQGIDLPDALL
ncbi:TAXI family TRAP transporter solute-binding subunit [Algihabitans albus]|uniref:TAXI family TRAP transporter solute-binding subunit n=1 Tax=Algihabitans albus TaxID=2164067 RepID=UPI000E5C6BB8|nr:TAXI family TRAP transporter solute-binding subunit [Algihabitans albus]